MRRKYKDKIIDIIDTMFMAHDEVIKELHNKEYDKVLDILAVCQEGAIAIGNTVEEQHTEETDIINDLVEYCKVLYEISLRIYEIDDLDQVLNDKLVEIQEKIQNKIKVHYEIVFLPYKSSMWDSLESIWRAAHEDENCICRVIPIPYFDKNPDGTFAKEYYEGNNFPDYVPITHYNEYSLEENMPDIIYYHNPYDEYNRVTSVHPAFYSSKLKNYCTQLVYVPYFIAGYYTFIKSASSTYTLPNLYADKMLVQSKVQQELLLQCSIEKNKILPLGSPKADAIINSLDNIKLPKEWKRIIEERKVFFVNSSIGRFLEDENWEQSMNSLIDYFEANQECALIWRPHPLLKATATSMRPQLVKAYDLVRNRIEELPNTIMDERDSAYPAIKYSDALISDYSSIVMEYTLTGKPILLLQGISEYRDSRYICCDYFSNYFEKDGMSIVEFCNLIKDNQDIGVEERQKVARNSLFNANGQCGKKVHEYILQEIIRLKANASN